MARWTFTWRTSRGSRSVVAAFVLVMLMFQAGSALAQTPDEACAADSLYLISPEILDLRLETTGRRGLTISWPNMDLSQATCFSLKNTEDLGFKVEVAGGFGDRVDRVFHFFSRHGFGEIGALQSENIIVEWQNEGPSTYGNVGGEMNLANNGGIWRYNAGSGWTQVNNQLPMYWLQANTVGLASGSGDFMVAGFSRGVSPESNPVGLFTFDGTAWTQIADTTFTDERLITNIAISPANNDMFAVGTARNGLFVTTNGGQTFDQWTLEFDPGFENMPTNFNVPVVEWSQNQIYAFVNNFGLFISPDNGASFVRSDLLVPDDLDKDPADQELILPTVNGLSFDPANPNRVAASLSFHGAYESTDAGLTWHDLYGDLVVPDPNPDPLERERGLWITTGLDIVYDEISPQTMILGVKQRGLYRSVDGGDHWVLVGDSVQPENRANILKIDMVRLAGSPGTIFALEDNYSLLRSIDSGATWEHFAQQPILNKGYFLLGSAGGDGNLTMGSWGGGMFIPGTPISLTDTYSTTTSVELRDMDLGLDITFSAGPYQLGDSFDLTCQTFQGWAVWRGSAHRPEEMTLLGLFDRVNPEDCFEGYCGDVNIEIVPNCFAAKRAACFDISNPDTLRFFDEEIYNGFTYNYSVTSFDYGNTALTTPENNSNEMIFSPRFEGDLIEDGGISPFPGPGNQTPIQINEPIAEGEEGAEEIFVFPNPLRTGAGFPSDEGGTVTFKNIPEGSKIMIYTTAGDRVIDLTPDTINGGNMQWNTRNSSGEVITSGVYLYMVDMVDREDYWGRLVVIR